MTVKLMNNDSSIVLTQTSVPEFPDNPQIIVWKDGGIVRAFTMDFGYGENPVSYIEQSVLVLDPEKEINK